MAGAVLLFAAGCTNGGGERVANSAPSLTTSARRAVVTTAPVPSSTIAPATSSTTPPREGGVILEAGGLSVASFGDKAISVVQVLSQRLGPPSADQALGSCPSGEVVRAVEFAELTVLFGRRQGVARFVAWDVAAPSGAFPPLRTAAGVGVGTTLAELQAAYGTTLVLDTGDPFGPSFEVQGPGPGRLAGTLSGTTAGDEVATLAGGTASCGR